MSASASSKQKKREKKITCVIELCEDKTDDVNNLPDNMSNAKWLSPKCQLYAISTYKVLEVEV